MAYPEAGGKSVKPLLGAWFLLLLLGCESNPMSSEALLSEGLKRALPDDQLGQAAHLQRLAEQSEWNLTRGWAGPVTLRTETSIDATIAGGRSEIEQKTTLVGDPFATFSGTIEWSGVDYSMGERSRTTRLWKDEGRLYVQEDAGLFTRIQENGPGTHRQVQRLLESWEVVLNGLGESLRWKERESSTRGGAVVLLLEGVCEAGARFELDMTAIAESPGETAAGWIVQEADGEMAVEAGSGKLLEGVLSLVVKGATKREGELRIVTRFSVSEGQIPLPPKDLPRGEPVGKTEAFRSSKALLDRVLLQPDATKDSNSP